MSSGVSSLPRDPDILIEMIAGLRAENEKLRAMLETLKRALYGARSEKRDAEEAQLALGLGDLSALPVEPAPDAVAGVEPDRPKPARPKASRNIGGLPIHLPREEIVIEPESDICPCCQGKRVERGMSLERLDRWFDTLDPPARVEGVSMLDGYLTAIIVGPRSVPPEEWFDDLFGARGHIASASGPMLTAIKTIVARFNAISQGLSTAPDRHAPIFRKTDDGQALPHLWCMGFLTGMRLRMDAWQPLLDLNRVDHGLLLPILLYCVDPCGQPMLGPPREGPETEEFLRKAYQDIPLIVPAIRDFFMPERVREANGQR